MDKFESDSNTAEGATFDDTVAQGINPASFGDVSRSKAEGATFDDTVAQGIDPASFEDVSRSKDGIISVSSQGGSTSDNSLGIAVPISEREIKDCVTDFSEQLNSIKLTGSFDGNSGVLLDPDQITLSDDNQYREQYEYDKGKLLGAGCFGDVHVVRDKSGSEHARKSVSVEKFDMNEIEAWIAVSKNSNYPDLFLFKIDKDENGFKVDMHQTYLKNAETIRSLRTLIMNRGVIQSEWMKPFSLFVLVGLLDAVEALHKVDWAHTDLLNDENSMVQKVSNGDHHTLRVKVLDLGQARRMTAYGVQCLVDFFSDIIEILQLFIALYIGRDYTQNQIEDGFKRWSEQSPERTQCESEMTNEHEDMLFPLVDILIKFWTETPQEFSNVKEQIRERKDRAMEEAGGERSVLQNVIDALFNDADSSEEPQETEMNNTANMNASGDTIQPKIPDSTVSHVIPENEDMDITMSNTADMNASTEAVQPKIQDSTVSPIGPEDEVMDYTVS